MLGDYWIGIVIPVSITYMILSHTTKQRELHMLIIKLIEIYINTKTMYK